MSIKLKGSTDGSVTLQAPADTSPTGTDKTLILPTGVGSANQFLQNGSTAGTLEFGSLVSGDMPTGSILQVVQSTYTSSSTHAASEFSDTGLEITITPTSSSSKVLIMTSFIFGQVKSPNANQDNMKYFTLFRGSTNIAPGNTRFFAHQNETSGTVNWDEQTQVASINYLDSPSTTSATTYKLRCSNDNPTEVTITFNRRGVNDNVGSAVMVAMEVAA